MQTLFNAILRWFLEGVRKLPGGRTAARIITLLVAGSMIGLAVIWLLSGIMTWLENTPTPFPMGDYLHQKTG